MMIDGYGLWFVVLKGHFWLKDFHCLKVTVVALVDVITVATKIMD